jgi:signal transduction histidine kinase/ligand-binding sensor domain-containing protein
MAKIFRDWRRFVAHGWHVLAVLAAAIVLVMAFPVRGEARGLERRLIDYKHSRWTAAEGVPPIIYAITQDSRGYILLGTSVGLYRFDGITFEQVTPKDRELEQGRILYLLNARDGRIWVAYDSGRIATYRNGILTLDRSAPKFDVEPAGMAQARDGAIWVVLQGTDRPFLRYAGGRWQRVNLDYDVSDHSEPVGIFAARSGSLWVETVQSLYVSDDAGKHFRRVSAKVGRTKLSEDRRGRLWISDDRGTALFQDGGASGDVFPTPSFQRWTAVTLFDQDDNIWIANGEGLFRVSQPNANMSGGQVVRQSSVEGMTAKDGLTADTTTPLFEDREGNIWVGTTRGLDEFRKVNIFNEPALASAVSLGAALLAASDGAVYIGTSDTVFRVLPHGRPRLLVKDVIEPRMICEAAGGEIWVMARDVFIRVLHGRITRFPLPAMFSRSPNRYTIGGCALDDHGTLWISRFIEGDAGAGLYTYHAGSWRSLPTPARYWPKGLARDRNGQPIALLKSGMVGPLDRNGVITRPYWTKVVHEGRALSPFPTDRVIRVTASGVVATFESGLVRRKGRALQYLDPKRFPWLSGPTDLVETPDGNSWLLTRSGIVRVSTAALDRAFDDPNSPIRPTVFDFDDGLPDVRNLVGQRGAVRGADGRLWFNLVGRVAWVDPARLVRNDVVPAVHIRGLTAGAVHYRDPATAIELAQGASSIAIQYTGLSLTLPRRVRFRYQLEGVDKYWVDAGGRREAFYTNLNPGTYRFRVMAANNDGVWNRQGATLDITIPPTFLQSIWFKLLCLLGLILVVLLLVRLRTRSVRARMQALFDAQMTERERIARELHDTLLQGVQGLTFVVQSAVEELPEGNPSRHAIEKALDRADQVISEGRDQVIALRDDAMDESLSDAVARSAAMILPDRGPRFRLSVEGMPQPLAVEATREILRIVDEALRNAVRHASATVISAEIGYHRDGLRLTVADDGAGIPADIIQGGGRKGHFGLVGMRERARHLAGELDIASDPATGTRLRLTVPGRIAYRDHRPGLGDRLKSLWRRLSAR